MRELLTPEEIAALTAAFASEAPAASRPPQTGVRPVDLANQERSLEGRLPGLELVVGRFGRGLRTVLASCFGDVPSVVTATLGLVRFARLAPRLAEPAGLVRFRLAPLRGQGLLAIPSSLVAALLQVA
jgi:flagellar motor switch protein FliM